jgi:hypothetical protein
VKAKTLTLTLSRRGRRERANNLFNALDPFARVTPFGRSIRSRA